MSSARRLLFVLLAIVFSGAAHSQEVITASAPGEVPRFISSANTVQMRVQIFSKDRAVSLDSTWTDGNLLDWPEAPVVAALPNGVYECTVQAKDLDGNVTEKHATLSVQDGHPLFEDRKEHDAMPVVRCDEDCPKATVIAHDGKEGSVISTAGDLVFRFGNVWLSRDREVMRLTPEGRLGIGTDVPQAPLDVHGLIRTTEGIMFPDGTILSSAANVSSQNHPRDAKESQTVVRRIVGDPLVSGKNAAASAALIPRTNAVPDYQFKADATGVHIGTTAAYGLDVAGNVTLGSNLALPTTSATAGVISVGPGTFAHNYGTSNTFVGTDAGNLALTVADAIDNTAVGFRTLASITHANGNTGVGSHVLENLQGGSIYGIGSGWFNTAMGEYALGLTTTGWRNTAIGSAALYNNDTGFQNIAIGSGSLQYNTTGSYNVSIGVDSGQINSTGSHNVVLGYQPPSSGPPSFPVGSYNIYIGDSVTDLPLFNESNTMRLGKATFITKTLIAGIRGRTTGGQDAIPVLIDSAGQLGTVSSSRRYKFDISDMNEATDALMNLRPVTFRYLAYGEHSRLQYGLIAEEVAEVYPDLVTRSADGSVETVMYQFLTPMLLNEIQKQHRTIEEMKDTIESLRGELADLAARVRGMEQAGR